MTLLSLRTEKEGRRGEDEALCVGVYTSKLHSALGREPPLPMF